MRFFTICFILLSAIYLFGTSFVFLSASLRSRTTLHFLYPNPSTVARVVIAESQHRDKDTQWFTRIFHNKQFAYMQDYFDNMYRSIDIPFLFTLTSGSSMYEDQGPIQMMFPWELLLFLVAIVFIIRSKRRAYLFLWWYLLVTIVIAAFFIPPVSQLKLFPEILGIRFLIVAGLYEASIVCIKKLRLQ